ncbi:unnamed protein product [Caenorhabditis sp. 36 PRJEB53466]|nr:unnamed protein product [Caenorhabditis sp. 36 PRJEB53466]
MKVPVSLAEIVSDFTGFHHIHPSKSANNFATSSSSPRKLSASAKSEGSQSRHSLNITVGVNGVPTIQPPVHFAKNSSSSSSISRVASMSSLQEKVLKMKRSESENEFSAAEIRKSSSVSSYRVLH